MKRLMALCGVFALAVGAVPLHWGIAHLPGDSGQVAFAAWGAVVTGVMSVVIGVSLVIRSLSGRPVRLSGRRSTRIMLIWWPIAGVLLLISSWDRPTMAGVALFPILVAFPVAAMFEPPGQQSRYARQVAAHPGRVQVVAVIGAIGGGLFAAMSVLAAVTWELGFLGISLAFFLMTATGALGQRADLKEFSVQEPQ